MITVLQQCKLLKLIWSSTHQIYYSYSSFLKLALYRGGDFFECMVYLKAARRLVITKGANCLFFDFISVYILYIYIYIYINREREREGERDR